MSARTLIASGIALVAIGAMVMRADGYQLFVLSMVGLIQRNR